MTNVKRPIHLQLRPASIALASAATTTTATCSPKTALSPTGDSLPSQILPHLFVGNLEQTNRDTLNRLNISYILSLGLLPLISNNLSPTSPTATPATTTTTTTTTTTSSSTNQSSSNQYQTQNHEHRYVTPNHPSPNHQPYGTNNHNILLPSQNSSKDFKLRLKSSSTISHYQSTESLLSPSFLNSNSNNSSITGNSPRTRPLDKGAGGENKGVKAVRYIQCKCINIADNSDQMLTKFFDEAHQFIDEARRKKCNILIHCLAGISRSPTIAIAYLMRVNLLRLQDAYNLVKQCRPQIDPNLSFMGQLMIYEKSLDERRKTNLINNNSNNNNNSNTISSSNVDLNNKL